MISLCLGSRKRQNAVWKIYRNFWGNQLLSLNFSFPSILVQTVNSPPRLVPLRLGWIRARSPQASKKMFSGFGQMGMETKLQDSIHSLQPSQKAVWGGGL